LNGGCVGRRVGMGVGRFVAAGGTISADVVDAVGVSVKDGVIVALAVTVSVIVSVLVAVAVVVMVKVGVGLATSVAVGVAVGRFR
jgi:hypothetical protein